MDIVKNQDIIEKTFLSILILQPKIGFDLLQIKPKFLENKYHSEILALAIEAMNKYKSVDIVTICSGHEKLLDIAFQAISDENVPISDIRQQFMTMQKLILESYKKKVIKNLSTKLNNGEIDCNKYLEYMEKVNEVVIKDETTVLDEQELVENISSKNIGIELHNYPKLNETLKLVQGDFLIIGASTGVGKSGLLLNLMNQLMDRYQCIYFNMEMNKSTIYKRIIAINSGIPVYDIDSPKSENQKNIIQKSIKEIVSKKNIVEHKASYLHEIKGVLGKHKDDKKHTIIFLDHIGLIKSFGKKSLYEQTTDVAKSLRQFCLDYDCTIIAACQLNRASYNSEELSLSMLKDSGELENSSSKVILLYRNKTQSGGLPKFTEDMVLEIVKNRDGRLGKIPFEYDKTKQIFKEKINLYENN